MSSTEQNQKPKQPKTLAAPPYPGLRAFTGDDSALFFGRTPEINALLAKIKASRFLAVIGASGSGKSSLVRAGVLPKLEEIAGGPGWEWLLFTPRGINDDPFLALSTVLIPVPALTPLIKRGNCNLSMPGHPGL